MNLLQSGINCVQLNGSMSLSARDAAIKKFTENPDCKIFLMSLKAGGVALNLTVASHVSIIFSCKVKNLLTLQSFPIITMKLPDYCYYLFVVSCFF